MYTYIIIAFIMIVGYCVLCCELNTKELFTPDLYEQCISKAFLCMASYYMNYPDILNAYIKLSGVVFTEKKLFYNSKYQTCVILGYSNVSKQAFIIFTGTVLANYMNVLEDLDYSLVPFIKGNVCHGFLYAYKSLEPYILEFLENKPGNIIVTGHSLGGAMATICASALKFAPFNTVNNARNIKVVTFASPKVGDTEFKNFFSEQEIESIQVANIKDVIPHFPLGMFETYDHVDLPLILTETSYGPTCYLGGAYVFDWNAFDWLDAHSLHTYIRLLSGCL